MSCQFFDTRGMNLLETYFPQTCVPALPGKRPRVELLSGLSYLRDGDESGTRDSKQYLPGESHDTVLRDALLFARWSKALARSHSNCKRIPVDLVLKMAVRMISHLRINGHEINRETLSATFWVALKFYSSRDTIPNASFMGMVTKTTKQALISNEPTVLAGLGWDVYAFFKQ